MRNMHNMQIFGVILISCGQLAHAYSSSLADCQTFAALWSSSCGGTLSSSAYTTSNWQTSGAGVTTSSCSTSSSDVYARQPDSGTLVNSYSSFARNCITCREDGSGGTVYIRYQTNNMPRHCYGSTDNSNWTKYPVTQKIDFEAKWNPNVLNTQHVLDSTVVTDATTSTLLCATAWATTVPSTSTLTVTAGTFNSVVGFSMDNVMITSAAGSRDQLFD